MVFRMLSYTTRDGSTRPPFLSVHFDFLSINQSLFSDDSGSYPFSKFILAYALFSSTLTNSNLPLYRPHNAWWVGLSYPGCRRFCEGAQAQAQ